MARRNTVVIIITLLGGCCHGYHRFVRLCNPPAAILQAGCVSGIVCINPTHPSPLFSASSLSGIAVLLLNASLQYQLQEKKSNIPENTHSLCAQEASLP